MLWELRLQGIRLTEMEVGTRNDAEASLAHEEVLIKHDIHWVIQYKKV